MWTDTGSRRDTQRSRSREGNNDLSPSWWRKRKGDGVFWLSNPCGRAELWGEGGGSRGVFHRDGGKELWGDWVRGEWLRLSRDSGPYAKCLHRALSPPQTLLCVHTSCWGIARACERACVRASDATQNKGKEESGHKGKEENDAIKAKRKADTRSIAHFERGAHAHILGRFTPQ